MNSGDAAHFLQGTTGDGARRALVRFLSQQVAFSCFSFSFAFPILSPGCRYGRIVTLLIETLNL